MGVVVSPRDALPEASFGWTEAKAQHPLEHVGKAFRVGRTNGALSSIAFGGRRARSDFGSNVSQNERTATSMSWGRAPGRA
jgi:hypothetical protein